MKRLILVAVAACAIIAGCSDSIEVDHREWDLTAQRIEDGADALREYAALIQDVESTMRSMEGLGRDIPSPDDLRVDAANFKRSNDAIVQGVKRRADALREYAAAMREAKSAMSGLDAAGGAPGGLWSGYGLASASEEQRECYFALLYERGDRLQAYAIGDFVLMTSPEDMDVLERRWMHKFLANWGENVIDHCDDYIFGGPQ